MVRSLASLDSRIAMALGLVAWANFALMAAIFPSSSPYHGLMPRCPFVMNDLSGALWLSIRLWWARGFSSTWHTGGASGRASSEITRGRGAAKAGERRAATTPDPLDGRPNYALFEVGDCLTLLETNHGPTARRIRSQRVMQNHAR